MKRVLYIVNPISGTRRASADLSERLRALTDPTVYAEAEVVFTERAGHATLLASQAAADGVDVVVAVGGDGTVNETARALVGTGSALGIVPRGSGNGLARHLQLPLTQKRAVGVINRACIRPLDSALMGERPFFCTCGVGFDAFISERFAEAGKRGAFTYLVNTLRSGLTFRPSRYVLRIYDTAGEEHRFETEAFLVAAANASQYGNNAFIAPSAHMSDGLLDVVIILPFPMIEGPQVALGLMDGTLLKKRCVKTFQTPRLIIERTAPGLAHLDGEPWPDAPAVLDVRIREKSLLTIVNDQASPRHCDLRGWMPV